VRTFTGLQLQTCRPQLCARTNHDPVIRVRKTEVAEDAADTAAAEAAMAEPGEDIPAEAVWAELGIADQE
jgi:hypothetical protein